MRLATRIALVKNCQTRSAIAVSRRQQSGEAAANEEYQVPPFLSSEATQAPARHIESYAKTGDSYKKAFASGNNVYDDSTRRVWTSAPHTLHTFSQEKFIFMSFNILASELAQKHKFLYSSVLPSHLFWSRRREKILQGLDLCSPDIICLQEVDRFADLEEHLALRGYVGLYKARTGEMPDGCAVFWRKNRFQLRQERSFEFSMLGMRNNVAQLCVLQLLVPDAASSSPLSSNDQVQTHCLIVGNIHVLYNPKRGDIKLGQCRAFLEQVHNMSSIWHGAPVVIGGDFNSTPSSAVYKYLATSELELANLDRTLLSGLVLAELDINEKKSGNEKLARGKLSVVNAKDKGTLEQETLDNLVVSIPHTVLSVEETCDDNSAAVAASEMELTETVIAGGSCSSDSMTTVEELSESVDYKHGWYLEELRIATGKDDCTVVRHELNLSSAYCDIQGCYGTRDAQGEPLLTTCHNKFLGTVDYIWRSDGLKTLRVLDTPPVAALAKNKGLPIKLWGSDHLPLACELAFIQDSKHIT